MCPVEQSSVLCISKFSSEVDESSVEDISSVKLVDESSVLVENTGLKLEELDEKAVVYQSVFSRGIKTG